MKKFLAEVYKHGVVKGLVILGILVLIVCLLASCGTKDDISEESGSLEEMAYFFDEHLFSYMDRRANGVSSNTGYLIMVDTTTCSIGGYVRNPYGGWTRDWGETAPIGKDIFPGVYRVDYKLDSFTIGDYSYSDSTWFSKAPTGENVDTEWFTSGLVFCNAETLPPVNARYRCGIYLSEEHNKWIFDNCQTTTPVVIFESEYISE